MSDGFIPVPGDGFIPVPGDGSIPIPGDGFIPRPKRVVGSQENSKVHSIGIKMVNYIMCNKLYNCMS